VRGRTKIAEIDRDLIGCLYRAARDPWHGGRVDVISDSLAAKLLAHSLIYDRRGGWVLTAKGAALWMGYDQGRRDPESQKPEET